MAVVGAIGRAADHQLERGGVLPLLCGGLDLHLVPRRPAALHPHTGQGPFVLITPLARQALHWISRACFPNTSSCIDSPCASVLTPLPVLSTCAQLWTLKPRSPRSLRTSRASVERVGVSISCRYTPAMGLFFRLTPWFFIMPGIPIIARFLAWLAMGVLQQLESLEVGRSSRGCDCIRNEPCNRLSSVCRMPIHRTTCCTGPTRPRSPSPPSASRYHTTH